MIRVTREFIFPSLRPNWKENIISTKERGVGVLIGSVPVNGNKNVTK